MTHPDDELAERFEARRNDPRRTQRGVSEVKVKSSASQVVSVRMPTSEFLELMDAVERSGDRLSDYVRGAVRMRTTLERLVGKSFFEVMADDLKDARSRVYARWSGNPLPYKTVGIPDFPPNRVAI
jgi:hypothetical protein